MLIVYMFYHRICSFGFFLSNELPFIVVSVNQGMGFWCKLKTDFFLISQITQSQYLTSSWLYLLLVFIIAKISVEIAQKLIQMLIKSFLKVRINMYKFNGVQHFKTPLYKETILWCHLLFTLK